MHTVRAACIAALCLAGACSTPDAAQVAARRAIEEQAAQERALAFLREMFPEVEGEITRDSIARALLASAPAGLGDARIEAIAAVRRGDDARAHALLAELLAKAEADRARKLVASGDPRGALAVLDRAVELAPQSADLRCLRGEVASEVGRLDREPAILASGLDDFVAAGKKSPSARAWLGASRAALALDRPEPALEYALRARSEMRGASPRTAVRAGSERVLADAALLARSRGDATRRAELTSETIRALEAALGRAPEDPRAWRELGAAYEEANRGDDALVLARRGIELFESDVELHALCARRLEASMGRPKMVVFEIDYSTRHPRSAPPAWHLARAAFDDALDAIAMGRDGRHAFDLAKERFAHARELDAGRAAECRRHEALCRAGSGWSALAEFERFAERLRERDAAEHRAPGDDARLDEGARIGHELERGKASSLLDATMRAFLSAEDCEPGGLTRSIPGRIEPALAGLERLGEIFARAAQDTESRVAIENLERAAKLYDYLHAYAPENPAYAHAAGAFGRDAAIAMRIDAVRAASAGRADEAQRSRARALELMESAARALDAAAKLSPGDGRIASEHAAILVHYLQRDAASARAELEHAITALDARRAELAKALAEPNVAPDERRARETRLEETLGWLGDALQNLGALHFTLLGDPKEARKWFEKSAATGPDPRAEISGKGGWLERCDDALAGKREPKIHVDERWDAPFVTQRNP